MSVAYIHSNIVSAARARKAVFVKRSLRLSTLARRAGLDPRREAVIAQLNGRWVLQRDWHGKICARCDVVHFIVLPQGNALRSIAQIAVLVIAAIAAPFLVAPLGLTGAALSAATAVATGALAIAGSYAVNALIPLPRQDAPGISTVKIDSPTYAFSIAAQNNQARLGGAIPEWFGRHRVVPDLAATAWWEWSGGVQTLYQTFCLSKGEIAVEDVQLGRTSASTFEDVAYQVFSPNTPPSLFEPNVYQSPDVSSVTLNAPNDLPGAYDDGVYGPFAAVPAGQTSARIGIDIAFPRGLFGVSGSSLVAKSAQWRIETSVIDDLGTQIGPWFVVANETFNADPGATNTSSPESGIVGQFMGGGYAATTKMNSPLTVSYRYTLPQAARYQVRLRRLDNKDLSVNAGHEVVWSGLRSFLGYADFGDVTILQVRIRATASVNARSARQVAVIGTRKLPMWNGTAWSAPAPTRSIAWAAAYVIRSENGGRQADANIDLDWLRQYDQVFAARGDTFNYYASEQRPLWEFLQTVLRCGRSVPYRQANRIRFFRDEPQSIPVVGFSRENIVARSLRIDYRLPQSEDEYDGFEIRFLDERTWNFNTLRKAFAGSAPPLNPQSLPLDGATDVNHVRRELDYMVAEHNLRPVILSFDTELEGLIPSRGDLVIVQHDAPRYGISNRVLSWDASTRTVELLRPPVWTFGAGWQARIRDRMGRYSAPVAVVEAPSSTAIVLAQDPVYEDGSPFDLAQPQSEFLHIVLGQAEDAPRRALVLETSPRQNGRVISIRAVIDDPNVHVN